MSKEKLFPIQRIIENTLSPVNRTRVRKTFIERDSYLGRINPLSILNLGKLKTIADLQRGQNTSPNVHELSTLQEKGTNSVNAVSLIYPVHPLNKQLIGEIARVLVPHGYLFLAIPDQPEVVQTDFKLIPIYNVLKDLLQPYFNSEIIYLLPNPKASRAWKNQDSLPKRGIINLFADNNSILPEDFRVQVGSTGYLPKEPFDILVRAFRK